MAKAKINDGNINLASPVKESSELKNINHTNVNETLKHKYVGELISLYRLM